MNTKKLILWGTLTLAVIVAILMYNKSRMDAKSKNLILGAVPVTVAPVTRVQLSNSHALVGTVAGRNDVAVVAETQGRIVEVAAEVGDHVRAGAVIVRVDDELKKAAYDAATVTYEKAKRDLQRQEALHGQQSTTDALLEAARLGVKAAEAQYVLAKRQYTDSRVTSPIDGVVTARGVNVGTYVQSGNVVANVVDISSLKVKVSVNENDVFRLHPGDKVTVTSDVYPKAAFAGTIRSISAKGDESHTYPVEVTLPNNAATPLKAGMFALVTFNTLEHEGVITIPRQALLGSVREARVFVVAGGVAKLREIVVDSEVGTVIEVLSGLAEGEMVVVNGQNNLKDNMNVEIVK
jgi:RND family efflux transporter MFP subunit